MILRYKLHITDNKMTIQLDEGIANTYKNSSKLNGFKTETMKKHYKANRTLRVRVTDIPPEMLINRHFRGCFMSFGSKMALTVFCTVILGIIAKGFHDIFAASCTMFCVKYFA